MNTTQIIVLLTIGGSLFIFDLVFLGIIFYTSRKVAQASNWPTTTGTVTLSEIQIRRSSKGGSIAYPVVHYHYRVMGQAYQGQKVAPGPDAGGSGARKVVAKYPTGAQVTVYYSPENPSEALLERDMPAFIKWFWVALVAVDLFLCGLGAVLVFTM